ncbi:MAG: hypothetical protein QXP98_02365 [Thermoproteus sp.]
MEKRYRFLDYYSIAASLGILAALASFLSSGPEPLYAVLGSAAGVSALVALFEWSCGYVRIFEIDDERISTRCLGKISSVARRGEVKALLVESSPVYSRLSFMGEGRVGHIEAPGYIVEKLARDIAAWWDLEVKEVWKPLLISIESRP